MGGGGRQRGGGGGGGGGGLYDDDSNVLTLDDSSFPSSSNGWVWLVSVAAGAGGCSWVVGVLDPPASRAAAMAGCGW